MNRTGSQLRDGDTNLDVGLTCYLVLLIPWGFGFGLLWLFRTSYMEMAGSLILAVAEIVAVCLILLILRGRERGDEAYSTRLRSSTFNLLILIILLLLPVLVGSYFNRLTLKVVSTVIWQFIFSGFGEEIRYRGYYHSRISQEYGRPFSFLGVMFGPGLIIASLLFAFSHVLNPFSPFAGSFELAWRWGFWTFFSGLFFGFVREKAGSIIVAGIARGLPDAVGEAFALLFSLSL